MKISYLIDRRYQNKEDCELLDISAQKNEKKIYMLQ